MSTTAVEACEQSGDGDQHQDRAHPAVVARAAAMRAEPQRDADHPARRRRGDGNDHRAEQDFDNQTLYRTGMSDHAGTHLWCQSDQRRHRTEGQTR